MERAVLAHHGQVRTLKEALQIATGVTVTARSPCLARLPEHAETLLNLCHRGESHDGCTPYARLEGKSWTTEFPPFDEVEAILNRLQTRKKMAVGSVSGNRHELNGFVGTAEGVHLVRSFRRNAAMHSVFLTRSEVFRGIQTRDPFDARGAGRTISCDVSCRRSSCDVSCRRSSHCACSFPACVEMLLGGKRRGGVPHSEQRRERIERPLRDDQERRQNRTNRAWFFQRVAGKLERADKNENDKQRREGDDEERVARVLVHALGP